MLPPTYLTRCFFSFRVRRCSLPACPPSISISPSYPRSVARGLALHACDARVHRPSSRGSHERKLLRSRLRVVLGTLYRRRRNPPGTLGDERHARAQTEGMGVARRIVLRRRSEQTEPGHTDETDRQTNGTDRQTGRQEDSGQAYLPGTHGALNPAGRQSTHLARMIRWIIACTVEIGKKREGPLGGFEEGRMPYGMDVPCALSAGCRKVRPVGIGMQIAQRRSHLSCLLLFACCCC